MYVLRLDVIGASLQRVRSCTWIAFRYWMYESIRVTYFRFLFPSVRQFVSLSVCQFLCPPDTCTTKIWKSNADLGG
jgi:hypothetical protein